MYKAVLLCLIGLCCSIALSQTTTSTSERLGAHSGSGRGCQMCHVPHGQTATVETADATLLPQDLLPAYGDASAAMASATTRTSSVQVCISCHDGVIAESAMLSNQTYAQLIGLEPAGTVLATLDESTSTTIDHPVGPAATLGAVGVAKQFQLATGGCTFGGVRADCLKVAPGAIAYRAFIANYGSPSITSNGYSSPVEMPDGNPANAYVVCTTCHTAHNMTRVTANADAPIAGSSTASFATFSYVAAPYNPSVNSGTSSSSSATQFCRQCHFEGAGGANEADGINSVRTAF